LDNSIILLIFELSEEAETGSAGVQLVRNIPIYGLMIEGQSLDALNFYKINLFHIP